MTQRNFLLLKIKKNYTCKNVIHFEGLPINRQEKSPEIYGSMTNSQNNLTVNGTMDLLTNMVYVCRYGIFECCDSLGDCLLSCLCPSCYAGLASDASGKNIACSILNCIFYPFGLICLRHDARKSHDIQVSYSFLFSILPNYVNYFKF